LIVILKCRSRFANRAADNFRALLSIAGDLRYPEQARSVAVKLCLNRDDDDIGVTLLTDTRQIFFEYGIDRIASEDLVDALHAIEGSFWSEWRGPSDDRLPHKLTRSELAALRPFRIRSNNIWPKQRRPGDRSKRGYLRSQFEAAWRSYCSQEDTPPQGSNIRYLRRI
jgi:hypothetical protein